MWDIKRDIVYKNDEMYNLMRALDIEDNIEHLRYDNSNFITPQRRRVGDLGENVAETFGAATSRVSRVQDNTLRFALDSSIGVSTLPAMPEFIPVNSLEIKLRALITDKNTPIWSFYTPLAAASLWFIIKHYPELDGSDKVTPNGGNPEVCILESNGKKFIGIYTAPSRVEAVFERLKISRAQFTFVSAPGYQLLKYLWSMNPDYLVMNEGVKECRYQLDPDIVEILLSRPEPEYEKPAGDPKNLVSLGPDESVLAQLEPLHEFLSKQPTVRAAWVFVGKPTASARPGEMAYEIGLVMTDPEDNTLLGKVETMAKALTPVEIEWSSMVMMAEDQSLRNLSKQQKPFYQAAGFLSR